jgi:hypothetical protein
MSELVAIFFGIHEALVGHMAQEHIDLISEVYNRAIVKIIQELDRENLPALPLDGENNR